MSEHLIAACRRFITGLLGEPFDGHSWVSKKAEKSRFGMPLNGWRVTTEDDCLLLDWADLTPEDEMVKLYAIIGFGLMQGVRIITPLYTSWPPRGGNAGWIHHVNFHDNDG